MTAPEDRQTAGLTFADVTAILDLVGRSDVEYLEVEVGGTRLVVDRTGTTVAAQHAVASAQTRPAQATAPAPASTAPPAAAAAAAAAAPAPAPARPAAGPAAAAPPAEDLLVVPAPMVGVFYRSPEPGAPPFVEVGSRVEEGATLGLIEVMKMFNSVTAPAGGEVVEVLADSEAFVEFGSPLFRLRRA